MTSAAPVAVVDLVSSLLESSMNSVFRFVGEGSPHISRATVEVRRPLQEMVLANRRRSGELATLLESLGGNPSVNIEVRSEEQYLAFLSLNFLLPKLVTEKKLCVERYENALQGVRSLPQVPPDVLALLTRHRDDELAEREMLERAAAHVAGAKSEIQNPKSETTGKEETKE